MIIDCLSDLHGFYPELPGGDLLIIAGDLTARDIEDQYYKFNTWICNQDYKKKIVIAGNHDGLIQKDWSSYLEGPPVFDYLCDSGIEFEGLKIYGSPWTPVFCNWHFMLRPEERKEKWDLIPKDTDILITHGPPYGLLDKTKSWGNEYEPEHVGCKHLRKQVVNGRLRNLKLHVFGHIHEAYGMIDCVTTKFVNCSIMNERYEPVNKPIRIEL